MSRQFWANVALCIVLGSLAIIALTGMGSVLTPKGLFVDDPQPSKEAAPLMSHVSLVEYRVGAAPGHMIEADFLVRNNSDQDVKNICVLCEFYNNSGEYMDRKRWSLPETVPAGQQVRIASVTEQLVNSRARALNCRISDFQLTGKPLFSVNRTAASGHGSPAGDGHSSPAAGSVH